MAPEVKRNGFRHRVAVSLLIVGICLMPSLYGDALSSGEAISPRPLPEFTAQDQSAWFNSRPLTVADLRGQVVLLDFWTFDCWNCYRSFPWLKSLGARYGSRGLRVIGVHTPESPRERDRAVLASKISEFGLTHPIMIDNDGAYWDSIGNRVWPAYYLADKHGQLRYVFIGETHANDAQAHRMEEAVQALLAE